MKRFGIVALVPPEAARKRMNSIIFEELCRGRFLAGSILELSGMIEAMRDEGIEGAILGCTELPLVIKSGSLGIPSWDTLGLHAAAAVDFILGD